MMTKIYWFVAVLVLVVGAVGGGWLWYRWKYPFGWSHSCDKQLMFALDAYAGDHGGVYPAGEETPEASLSLLYPKYANGYVLQGKTVPLEVVRATLERGERLGPDTCGWHYVEGLRRGDDPRLALFWDKAGLGHNGERLPDGGHTVFFVRLHSEYIPGAAWEGCLLEQWRLQKQRAVKRSKQALALSTCRQPSDHVRRCWAVDLILGRKSRSGAD